MAPITPATIREQAERLATFEGTEYYAISVVYRVNRDGELLFYSTLGEWPRTEIGRVAGLIEEVDRLKRRNVDLEERLEAAQDIQSIVVGATAQLHHIPLDALPDLPTEETRGAVLCSCGRSFADKRALSAHQRRAFVHKV